jgi:hypothetical protein
MMINNNVYPIRQEKKELGLELVYQKEKRKKLLAPP